MEIRCSVSEIRRKWHYHKLCSLLIFLTLAKNWQLARSSASYVRSGAFPGRGCWSITRRSMAGKQQMFGNESSQRSLSRNFWLFGILSMAVRGWNYEMLQCSGYGKILVAGVLPIPCGNCGGRGEISVLARHYIDYSQDNLKKICDKARLKVTK